MEPSAAQQEALGVIVLAARISQGWGFTATHIEETRPANVASFFDYCRHLRPGFSWRTPTSGPGHQVAVTVAAKAQSKALQQCRNRGAAGASLVQA